MGINKNEILNLLIKEVDIPELNQVVLNNFELVLKNLEEELLVLIKPIDLFVTSLGTISFSIESKNYIDVEIGSKYLGYFVEEKEEPFSTLKFNDAIDITNKEKIKNAVLELNNLIKYV